MEDYYCTQVAKRTLMTALAKLLRLGDHPTKALAAGFHEQLRVVFVFAAYQIPEGCRNIQPDEFRPHGVALDRFPLSSTFFMPGIVSVLTTIILVPLFRLFV